MQNIITYMTTLVADQGWNMLALGWFIIAVRGYQTYAIGAARLSPALDDPHDWSRHAYGGYWCGG